MAGDQKPGTELQRARLPVNQRGKKSLRANTSVAPSEGSNQNRWLCDGFVLCLWHPLASSQFENSLVNLRRSRSEGKKVKVKGER